jgi:hypothetical protein
MVGVPVRRRGRRGDGAASEIAVARSDPAERAQRQQRARNGGVVAGRLDGAVIGANGELRGTGRG